MGCSEVTLGSSNASRQRCTVNVIESCNSGTRYCRLSPGMIDCFCQLLFCIFNDSYIKKYFVNIFACMKTVNVYGFVLGVGVAIVKLTGSTGYKGLYITVHITMPARVRVRDGSRQQIIN